MSNRLAEIVAMGSPNYNQDLGIIAATAEVWYDMKSTFPGSQIYDYFDSIVITNNSAEKIEFYLNTKGDTYTMLAFQVLPLSGRAFRYWGVKNLDAVNNTAASEINLQMRRLPPQVQPVINVR